MPDNYKVTAQRVGKSSASLHAAKEYFNACYLAGYVAECYQKVILKELNAPNSVITGHDVKALKNDVQQRYAATAASQTLRYTRANIRLSPGPQFPRILASWDPKHRYSDSHPWDESTSKEYQKEAKEALNIIDQLTLNGFI